MTNIEQMIKDLCPNGVEYKKLGEVCEMKRGSTITANQAEEGEIPVIAGGQKPAYFHNQSNRTGKNITVAGSGAYAGYVAYWEQPIFVSDAFTVTPKESSLDIKFVYYFLTNIQDKIYHTKKGSGVPHVHPSSISDFEIPIPPLEIQKKIVECLDKFSALAAELQAELHLRRKQYEYYRTRLLTPHSESNSADKSDDCNWDFKPLGEICDLVKDRISASELDEDTYVSVENLLSNKQGKIPSMSVPTIGNVINYHKDNVLIGNIRPYLRKIWLADNEGGTNGDVITLGIKGKYRDMILPRFLYHALADERFFIYDTQYSSGAKMPRGDKDKVLEYQIAIPSIEKQAELVVFLDKFEKLITSMEEGIPAEQIRQQKRYEYYRDLLLTFPRKAV